MSNKIKNNLIVIFCPSISYWKTPPLDISECRLVDCPLCKIKMWLSVKKENIKKDMEALNKEILYGCHDCCKIEIEKTIKSLPKEEKIYMHKVNV